MEESWQVAVVDPNTSQLPLMDFLDYEEYLRLRAFAWWISYLFQIDITGENQFPFNFILP